jgi:sugar lactone lactonase YvrE
MLFEEGKDPVPLVNTAEETGSPVTNAGPGEIAFLIGPEPSRTIATATVANGRITRRISFDKGPITGLAASPDGATLYCVANGKVWAIAVAGGEPKEIRGGDSVAVSPDGKELLVQQAETTVRLVRVPLDGRPEQEIPLTGPLRLFLQSNPGAIGKDGRILTPLGTSTWYQPPGMLDPATGRLTRIKTDYVTDVHSIAWTPDGQVMALGFDLRSTMWRFQAEGR